MNAEHERSKMVDSQLRSRGIRDERVLQAMAKIPRQEFVPPEEAQWAYKDGPLLIGHGQTISQPYVVALMAEKLEIKPTDRILEIGGGCGYSAAVMAEIAKTVFSIEIIKPLYQETVKRLERLGYTNIRLRLGDGQNGWPEEAPFDKIVLAAAPEQLPDGLFQQLKQGGYLIAPVGGRESQQLLRFHKTGSSLEREVLGPVSFVPLTAEAHLEEPDRRD